MFTRGGARKAELAAQATDRSKSRKDSIPARDVGARNNAAVSDHLEDDSEMDEHFVDTIDYSDIDDKEDVDTDEGEDPDTVPRRQFTKKAVMLQKSSLPQVD